MNLQKYRIKCTLSFGDIYAQILAWLGLIFLSVASGLALWASSQQIYAIAATALVVVMSLPFLLFAFVTTLLNHIEVKPVDDTEEAVSDVPSVSGQQTAQPAS
jgi:uncharacterized membrane protein (UPF0182 family)